MKIIVTIAAIFCSFLSVYAQNDNQKYDSLLAKKLNADDYGMRSYVFVILKTGNNKMTDKKYTDSCFRGHMANIEHLVQIGKLIVAGPMGKNEKSYRGIFIMNVKTIEEAKEFLQQDTAIAAGLLEPEYFQWYGSAALPEYLDASDKIWKKRH